MLKASNPNAKYCYKKAFEARERALQAKQGQDRLFYFEAEARWLKLAESYEFTARAKRFMATPSQRPSCPACAAAMPLAEVQTIRSAVDYRYECKECGYNTHITMQDD